MFRVQSWQGFAVEGLQLLLVQDLVGDLVCPVVFRELLVLQPGYEGEHGVPEQVEFPVEQAAVDVDVVEGLQEADDLVAQIGEHFVFVLESEDIHELSLFGIADVLILALYDIHRVDSYQRFGPLHELRINRLLIKLDLHIIPGLLLDGHIILDMLNGRPYTVLPPPINQHGELTFGDELLIAINIPHNDCIAHIDFDWFGFGRTRSIGLLDGAD